MAQYTIYQIDAFADKLFCGNPAAVIILSDWISTQTMQNIAMENNLSETAFIVSKDNFYHIRFFTPVSEVELCGHATLASAFVLFNLIKVEESIIAFSTQKRGNLSVEKSNNLLILDFPTDEISQTKLPNGMSDALGAQPKEFLMGKTDIMLIYENEEQIRNINPNFELLKRIDVRGIIITAKGNDCDFVSRFFAPTEGINEDPVTGSAHTTLIPYWSKQLNKTEMTAKQISKRGGILFCEYNNDRVKIAGKAVHYMTGTITI